MKVAYFLWDTVYSLGGPKCRWISFVGLQITRFQNQSDVRNLSAPAFSQSPWLFAYRFFGCPLLFLQLYDTIQ